MVAEDLELDTVVPPLLAEAGAIALKWFRTALIADDKNAGRADGFDPVTEADRGIEDLLRRRLSERYPDHQIIGEEQGVSGTVGRYRWLIDPIDGTKSFVSGSPLWGILLGLLDGDEPIAGWVHQPYLDETFASVGSDAWFAHAGERRPLRSRTGRHLDSAVMYTTFPGMFSPGRELDAFTRLSDAVQLTRFGGDCYSYCMLAMGQVDLVVEASLQPYDIVPLIPIVEASGGVITDLSGHRPLNGGFVVAAANADLHREAMDCIVP
ncbi:inositol monophosphatase family protein [Desertimonas flava]|jgi:myo-inositol-1(or 4)-monophosphatase|uniref:inositol monophosphatase family protein n=1 Tax=Desertimonas flava TaxID=2064846 RepID=UPI000E3431AB|nr:inositol monophosphatase family protein [Desertimonas flava]